MSSLEPLRLLEELLKPDKNNKTLAQKISKMDSEDALALESMADELEKGSKSFQADTITYYLDALKQFKTKGNVEAADRIKNKLETLADACVKDGMWKIGFAGLTSSTDIIAAYWEVGAIEKIRKFADIALEENVDYIAIEALEKLGEKPAEKLKREFEIKSIIEGGEFGDIYLHKINDKKQLIEIGDRALKLAREKLIRAHIIEAESLVSLSVYLFLLEREELEKEIPELKYLEDPKYIFEILVHLKREKPGRYEKVEGTIKAAFMNPSLMFINDQDDNKITDIERQKLLDMFKKLYLQGEETFNILSKYYVSLKKKPTYRLAGLLIWNRDYKYKYENIHRMIENASRAYKESGDRKKMMLIAKISEKTKKYYGVYGALGLYTFLEEKKSVKRVLNKELNNHLQKKFEKSEEEIIDPRHVNDDLIEAMEFIDHGKSFFKVAMFYFKHGLIYRALEMYKKAGQYPSKRKIEKIARQCYEAGNISDAISILEDVNIDLSFNKIIEGVNIAIEKSQYLSAETALSNLYSRKDNTQAQQAILDQKWRILAGKQIEAGEYICAKQKYELLKDKTGFLNVARAALKAADENGLLAWIGDLLYAKKNPGMEFYNKLVKNKAVIALTNRIGEELLERTQNGKHAYTISQAFTFTENEDGLLRLAEREIELGWYKSALERYEYLGKPVGEALRAIGSHLKEKILSHLKNNLEEGLTFLVSCLKSEFREEFKIDVRESKPEEGHASDVSAVQITSETLFNSRIVLKIEDHSSPMKQDNAIMETSIYEKLKKHGITCPTPIKNGSLNNKTIGVFEYIGEPLFKFEVTRPLLRKVILHIHNIQNILSREEFKEIISLLSLESGSPGEQINNRLKKIGVQLSAAALSPLNKYLAQKKLQKYKTWTSDRHTANFTYDSGTKTLGVIDFNVIRFNYPQEDWVWFIDDPKLKTKISRENLIKEFVYYSPVQEREGEPGEKTELYHYMAVYRNLRMAAARWVDTRDQNVSRYHLERAKMSALTLEMKLLIKEIEEKIERLYYT